MQQKQPYSLKTPNYYFTRLKDAQVENGEVLITVFLQLTAENEQGIQIVWVELDKVPKDQATTKLQAMADGIHTYSVSKRIFEELVRLSVINHKELYYLTPFFQVNKYKKLN